METMTTCHCRHLPVVENGKLLGIVSIGDLVKKMLDEKQQEVDKLSEYIKENRHKRTSVLLDKLTQKLRGHYGYFGVVGNLDDLFAVYFHAVGKLYKWLNRRSQRHSFDWDGFNRYLKHYPLPTPRIAHNLYTLSPVT